MKHVSLRDKFWNWEQYVYDQELVKVYPELKSLVHQNKIYLTLFHQVDFEYLRHPKFWNTGSTALTKKERTRNCSPRNSVSKAEINYIKSESDTESVVSKSKKSSKTYVSKKRLRQLEKDEEDTLISQTVKKVQRIRQEEEYTWSKHVTHLQHLADVCEDYNYLVDSLEEEHQRRAVHTTTEVDGEFQN